MRKGFLFFLMVLYTTYALSQSSGIGSTVLLKGRVVNQKNLSPIETRFFLVGEDGKKIQVKSSSDGSFSIPINNSGSYKVQSENWLCTDPNTIPIYLGERYTEKEVTLYFLPLEPGLTLKKVYGFEFSTKHLTHEGKEALGFLNELNKSLPKLFFSLVLYINESQFHTQTKTLSEGKKKKKITITARQQAEEFASEISKQIKDYLKNLGFPERKYKIFIEYISGVKSAPKSKKDKSKEEKKQPLMQKSNNLEIKIDSILQTELEKTR